MEPTKRCPMCGELILAVAIRCKHCQADLRAASDTTGPFARAQQAAVPSSLHPLGARSSATEIEGPQHPLGAPFGGPVSSLPQPPDPQAHAPAHDPASPLAAAASSSGPTSSPAASSGDHPPHVPIEGDFEQRFLDFAFKTTMPINGTSVAYALKIPIDEANEQLEDLAARDILLREVDARGLVFFQLPGRPSGSAAQSAHPSTALSPYAQPPTLLYEPLSPNLLTRTPTESAALGGLLVNVLFMPGLGSLIGGKTTAGVFQMLMFIMGAGLCFTLIGIPLGLPMFIGAWVWGLVTGVNMLSEAKQSSQQRLPG